MIALDGVTWTPAIIGYYVNFLLSILDNKSFVYMFPIAAGQTAGPIGLKFFADSHGWPGCLRK